MTILLSTFRHLVNLNFDLSIPAFTLRIIDNTYRYATAHLWHMETDYSISEIVWVYSVYENSVYWRMYKFTMDKSQQKHSCKRQLIILEWIDDIR